jgi:predicted XRE-type DNA-binding protein
MPKSRSKEKPKPKEDFAIVKGSGNVFKDLGFADEEAVNLLARSTLMIEIKNIIDQRKLTQSEAAKILGVRQPRVSALYTGRLEDFTVDMLMKWLSKLGKRVTITIGDLEVA